MKKIACALLLALVIASSVVGYSENLSEDIAENIVRLHVVANSNSEIDQAVKLKVRDAVLEKMEGFESPDEIKEKLFVFEEAANAVLAEEGFSYRANAEMGVFDFPTKYYDNFALPKGSYEAVRITLGLAEGENWWCVLFPPLCMVDAAGEESDRLLRETFGENYETVVLNEEKPKFNIKFKIAEWF